MTHPSEHPLYFTWRGIMQRCENPWHPECPDYGGRGITIYVEWRDPTVFIEWIEQNLGSRPDGRHGSSNQPCYTLDRIDNDKGYEPGNLRWADKKQQASNRRLRSCSRRNLSAEPYFD